MNKFRISREHNIVKINMEEVTLVLPVRGTPDILAQRYARQIFYGLQSKIKEELLAHRQDQ